jgi:hypothetical protein
VASTKKKAKKRRVYKGVRPRPDCGDRYEIQWMVRDPVTGNMKRRRELLQTTNEGEAILQRAQRIRAEEAAAPEPIANITLNDFAERYLASHKHQKDYVSKRQRLTNYILPALGDRPIVSISVYEYEPFRRSVVGECATTAERLGMIHGEGDREGLQPPTSSPRADTSETGWITARRAGREPGARSSR